MYHKTECGCGQHGQSGGSGMGHGGEWGHHVYMEQGREHYRGSSCGCGYHHGGMHDQRGCLGHGFMQRRFIGKEEAIAKLEEYLKQLQAEVKGVEEHLAEMKKGD